MCTDLVSAAGSAAGSAVPYSHTVRDKNLVADDGVHK